MTTIRPGVREDGKIALVPELVTGHVLMMRLAAAADGFLGQEGAAAADDAATVSLHTVRTAGMVARLMDRYRRGVVMLDRLSRADPDGAFAVAVRTLWADVRQPDPGEAIGAAPPPVAAPGPGLGRLRHGNPPGDFRTAPRCGARTRAGGCCRQPAMANGRCRLHGGKSTGPRTAAGLQRSRTSHLVHGGRARRLMALRSAAAKSAARLARLTRMKRSILAGHGLHGSESIATPPASGSPAPSVDCRSALDRRSNPPLDAGTLQLTSGD